MNAVELQQISKRFGPVTANDAIDLEVKRGEIHCLLGENGAGKTTLMKILFGLYARDAGKIFINSQETEIHTPKDAIALGIGMIHQHFMLVNRLTAAENIVAGQEPKKGLFLDLKRARQQVAELSQRYGLKVNPQIKIEDISVGEQQRVEILKTLYRQAEILILDEPTAVLTPQEVEELFYVLQKLKDDGKTIIFITHKLKETMAISDRITVLRDGKKVGTVRTAETNPQELARMMVGREVILRVTKADNPPGQVIFEAQHLYAVNKKSNVRLKDITLSLRQGEIVGIAGVEGNGQLELEEVFMGLRAIERGQILLHNRQIQAVGTAGRRASGLAHIPSDRLRRGLIPTFNLEKNMILGFEWHPPFARHGILSQRTITRFCRKRISDFQIRCSHSQEQMTSLSGGNQQKVILARELSGEPQVIIAAQPTRGVDVGAIEYIHNLLLTMRAQGKAILLISAELDELKSLSDRILVLYEGAIIAEGKAKEFTEQELGLLMAGHRKEVM
ncbi:ABC transporter related [Candidatus Vecturithrix granuli]|uniref:ABC transporter related n=1 Tax=Vecturithrix granuli TaxID=1499967 RepID=A0A081BY69_VECG1|nr:ABC transporter related [Candidatus Vecturithrix granuli]